MISLIKLASRHLVPSSMPIESNCSISWRLAPIAASLTAGSEINFWSSSRRGKYLRIRASNAFSLMSCCISATMAELVLLSWMLAMTPATIFGNSSPSSPCPCGHRSNTCASHTECKWAMSKASLVRSKVGSRTTPCTMSCGRLKNHWSWAL